MLMRVPEDYVGVFFAAFGIVVLLVIAYFIGYAILFRLGGREVNKMFDQYDKAEDVQAPRTLPIRTGRRTPGGHRNTVRKIRGVQP